MRRARLCSSLALLISLLGSGCVTGVRMDPELQSKLHAIHFSHEFEGADKPYISDGGLAMFGLIGVAASAAQTKSRREQLHEVMEANGIPDAREMVFERFVDRLLVAGYAPVRDPAQADATLRLWIDWGLGEPGDLSEKLRPYLNVVASLEDTSGKVLWRCRRHTLRWVERPPGFTFDEFIESPQRIREAFTSVVHPVVDSISAALLSGES